MKKNRVFGAFGILTLLCITGFADVIVPNTHLVAICDKIVNVNDFPDIAVIGYQSSFLSTLTARYIVQQDSCLRTGNKYFGSRFLWATKQYVDSVGLDSLPIADFVKSLTKKTASRSAAASSGLHLLSPGINTSYIWVPDSIKLISEELFYKLFAGSSDIYVYLSKCISHFSDSTTKTDSFAQPSGVRQPQFRVVPHSGVENIFLKNGLFTFKAEFNGGLHMALMDCRGRIVLRNSMSCTSGRTYVSDLGRLKSGLYWLRLTSPNVDVTKRLTIIR
jgi:hypothetical protein